jgi:hypothetical protein
VSALAKLLELKGIPTTTICLVRPPMEKIGPPRALWVPFELGRPLGEPNDPAFQRRVLLQALRLLERKDGYWIVEDFPDDAPSWADLPGWTPPFSSPARERTDDPAAFRSRVEQEVATLAPYWAAAKERFGRTTVGNSGLSPETLPEFITGFLGDEIPVGGPAAFSDKPALALRFAIDDLKAYYSEAAMSDGKTPASRQVDGWFWHETAAGDLIRFLRAKGMESELNAMKVVSSRFFVPNVWVQNA